MNRLVRGTGEVSVTVTAPGRRLRMQDLAMRAVLSRTVRIVDPVALARPTFIVYRR